MSEGEKIKLRLGLLLRQSHSRAAAALNEALSPLHLTGRHFGVMLSLDREGVSSQRRLIRQLGSDKAGMVRTVDDLEALGYLQRTQSSTDRRVSDLSLTPKGKRTFADANTHALSAADRLFRSFTQTELEVLETLLSRFVGSDPAAAASSPAPGDDEHQNRQSGN
jgi:DNA-binding MarR family transcriptional regulator